jgi:hypothetical protein
MAESYLRLKDRTMTPTFESNVMDFDQSREHEGDNKLYVVFYTSTELNEAKSLEAGRPVHDEIDLVKIITPGQRDSVVSKATYDYQQRFPRQWDQYKRNVSQNGSGTPLSEVSFLTLAQIADLKASNVHTVEQLAGMSDSQAHNLMGFHALKALAVAYVEQAKGNAPLVKMQAELEERDAKIAAMQSQLDQILAAQTNAKMPGK